MCLKPSCDTNSSASAVLRCFSVLPSHWGMSVCMQLLLPLTALLTVEVLSSLLIGRVRDRFSLMCGKVQGGGGISWHFNFAWEISRFKLTAKFPARNSGFSAKFSYTTSTHSTHCGL